MRMVVSLVACYAFDINVAWQCNLFDPPVNHDDYLRRPCSKPAVVCELLLYW